MKSASAPRNFTLKNALNANAQHPVRGPLGGTYCIIYDAKWGAASASASTAAAAAAAASASRALLQQFRESRGSCQSLGFRRYPPNKKNKSKEKLVKLVKRGTEKAKGLGTRAPGLRSRQKTAIFWSIHFYFIFSFCFFFCFWQVSQASPKPFLFRKKVV